MVLSTCIYFHLHLDAFFYMHLYSFQTGDAAFESDFDGTVITYLPDFPCRVPSAPGSAYLALQILFLYANPHLDQFRALCSPSIGLPIGLFNNQLDRLEALLSFLVVAVANTDEPLAIQGYQLLRT